MVVAEDTPEVLRTLARHLEHSGHRVTAVETGEELANLLSSEVPIDLMILDLCLGSVNALDVVETCPRPGDAQSPPIVIFSGSLQPRDYGRARSLGIDNILQKPVRLAELDTAIEMACGGRTSHSSVHGLSLIDLLQAYHLARSTVVLTVSGPPVGTITLVDGELVDAWCANVTGEPALETLLRRGTAVVNSSEVAAPDRIRRSLGQQSFDMLLLDALRRIDESSRSPTLRPTSLAAMMVVSEEPAGQSHLVSSIPPAPRAPRFPTPPPERDVNAPQSIDGSALDSCPLAELQEDGFPIGWLSDETPRCHALRDLVYRVVNALPLPLEWAAKQWLAVATRSESLNLGLGIFASPPRVCVATFDTTVARQRFYATLVRAAATSLATEKPRRRRQSETMVWPAPDETDAQLVNLCSALVQRQAELVACKIIALRPHSRRGRHTSEDDDWIFSDSRWALAEALLSCVDEGEVIIGAANEQRGALIGFRIDSAHLMVCIGRPHGVLGAVHNAARANLARLRQALHAADQPSE